jgi:hypothetical protein
LSDSHHELAEVPLAKATVKLPQAVLQVEFQNLSVGVSGQCFDKNDLPGQFNFIDSETKELDEFEFADARGRLERVPSARTFPNRIVDSSELITKFLGTGKLGD